MMTTGIAPDRTLEQRLAALRRANDVRTKRAGVKRDIKHRRVRPVDVLDSPPPEVHTMRVLDFLLAIPSVGRVKANRVLASVGMSPNKTLIGLSDRQRRELSVHLRAEQARYALYHGQVTGS